MAAEAHTNGLQRRLSMHGSLRTRAEEMAFLSAGVQLVAPSADGIRQPVDKDVARARASRILARVFR
jgi:hypothetical protein